MKILEVVEIIQQHFPEMSANEIVRTSDRVLAQISARTGYGNSLSTSIAGDGENYYFALDSRIREVSSVADSNGLMPRLIDIPVGKRLGEVE